MSDAREDTEQRVEREQLGRLKPLSDPPSTSNTRAKYEGLTDLGVVLAVSSFLHAHLVPDWMVPLCIVGLFALAGVSLKLRGAGRPGDASIFMGLAAVRVIVAGGHYVSEHAHRAGPWIVALLALLLMACATLPPLDGVRTAANDATTALNTIGRHVAAECAPDPMPEELPAWCDELVPAVLSGKQATETLQSALAEVPQ